MDERDLPPEPPRHAGPADWFTVPGRLLLIATFVGCGAAFFFLFVGTIDELPAGRYPVLMWVVPVLLGGVGLFLGAAFLLERAGIRVYRRDRD